MKSTALMTNGSGISWQTTAALYEGSRAVPYQLVVCQEASSASVRAA